MKCTNRKSLRLSAFLLAVLVLAGSLSGCSWEEAPDRAFTADRPGLGIQGQAEAADIAYFAEDLCVVAEDIKAMEAEAADGLSACFFCVDTKEILYAKNIHGQVYPASTTKIMTALLLLEQGDLEAQATVSKTAITLNDSGATTAKLKEGDILTLRQLLYALMTVSANDAANVIAEKIGGSIEGFVGMMNERAAALGATNTHFVNPHGLHHEDHYTTAYDLYLIFQEVIKYDAFLEVIRVPSYETTYMSADGREVSASWSSSDRFTTGDVTVPEGVTAVGGKTGSTKAAMSCLVQLFEDSAGQRYVAVILGCSERAVLYEEMQGFLSGLNN